MPKEQHKRGLQLLIPLNIKSHVINEGNVLNRKANDKWLVGECIGGVDSLASTALLEGGYTNGQRFQ